MEEKYEDEINLHNYIEVLIKRKKIILSVFFIFIITTAIVSLYLPKVYQSTTSIMITPSRVQALLSPADASLDIEGRTSAGVTLQPAISLSTHKTLLRASPVLEKVIDKLRLTDKLGQPLIFDDLIKRLNVKEITGTNILQLEAKDNDPKMAREITNAWAQEYIKYSGELISGTVKGAGDFVTEQFEIVLESLTRAEEKIKEFKNKYRLDLMQAELSIKKEKLKREKEELINSGIALKTKEDSLKELKKGIEGEEKFVIISKAITDDALWQKIDKEGRLGNLAEKKLMSENINPLYQDLKTRIVNIQIELNTLEARLGHLDKSVELTAKEIDELGRVIHQKEFELTQLTRQAEIYKRTYENLAVRIEEVRIAKAMELGEVKIVSPATEPKRPIYPRKMLNVSISGVLGLFLGVFVAFFQEFWKKGKI
ncbi:MAG: Tyrosine-protein kinase ptk [candidate division WS2 bacterium]|nr:Tyrosine-protein kinase ptk [Candidatus Psychracetigena formicireducens]